MKLVLRLMIIFLVFLVLRATWAIDRLEGQNLILKNCFEEMKVKHNRLRVIVQGIYETKG